MRIIDRGVIFDAARHSLTLHQWLTTPDFDQEGEVQQAEAALATPEAQIAAACRAGGACLARSRRYAAADPCRVGPILDPAPPLPRTVPLTGATALRAETPGRSTPGSRYSWPRLPTKPTTLDKCFSTLERAWFAARRAVTGRRSNSRAAIAIDMLAATPLISATSLARGLGMAPKNALELLTGFCADEITIEVTHRSKRRLFGLAGLAPLRDEISPPHRPEPGRGRGRPPTIQLEREQPFLYLRHHRSARRRRSKDGRSTTANSSRGWRILSR